MVRLYTIQLRPNYEAPLRSPLVLNSPSYNVTSLVVDSLPDLRPSVLQTSLTCIVLLPHSPAQEQNMLQDAVRIDCFTLRVDLKAWRIYFMLLLHFFATFFSDNLAILLFLSTLNLPNFESVPICV